MSKQYPVLNIRLDAATKAAYHELCAREGTTISADVKSYIDQRLAAGRRKMKRHKATQTAQTAQDAQKDNLDFLA